MLANKVVMITGVGSGLGRALVTAFVEQGCEVIGIARRDETLRETTALVGEERFQGYVADVACFDEVKAVVNAGIDRHGRIDMLFNNAAVYPRVNFTEESADDWARAIDVNVNGVANACKAVLPAMIAAGYGRMYNVGSFADLAPIADSAVYSASKGAVRALTKAIAADIAEIDADIEVHEWIPGHLKTRMSGYTGLEPAVAAGWGVQLASMERARTPNCIFENDHEWLPPKGLKQRIGDKLRAIVGSGQ
jgi:NADP-dependent 3-hydroxy acid dehydrogenase YdfG